MVTRSAGKEENDGELRAQDYYVALICDVFKKLPSEVKSMPYEDYCLLREYCKKYKCGSEWDTVKFTRLIQYVAQPHMKKDQTLDIYDIFPEQFKRDVVVESNDKVANAFYMMLSMATPEQPISTDENIEAIEVTEQSEQSEQSEQ
ncbi:hypothetical protein [Shewanella sp.]|uniref:hypothetical protein n=1 Tax=Shewanella sp. TaxID=50422 RepID=UPI004047751C